MTITVDIRPEVQAELVRQAAARGSALETYAANLLKAQRIFPLARTGLSSTTSGQKLRGRIRELRKGGPLGGLTIREPIHEGRR